MHWALLDAVDKYPVTSDQQREKISEVLCGEQSTEIEKFPIRECES